MTCDPDSLFTKFILEQRHYRTSDNTAKHTAFMPDKNGETSVFKINDISEATIWDIGDSEVAVNRKPVQARADINQKLITEAGLIAKPDQSTHHLHHVIVGWPDDRLERQEKARQLASNAQFYLRP